MYIEFLSIYYMLQNCLNIIFLYLHVFRKNRIFISKILVLENTEFGFWLIFQVQKWFKMFVIYFDFYLNMFVYQKYNKNLFLWNLCIFMGFYKRQKDQFLNPEIVPARLWRSTDGRPDQ